MIQFLPGRRLRHLARLWVKYARRPRRYRRVIEASAAQSPRTVVEIGVYTGQRGVEIIEAASLGRRAEDIAYHGFDLFELMDEAIRARELSKRPDPMAGVQARLQATGADIHLHKGWSQETLPALAATMPDFRADFVFIDGGHAVETIRSDWDNVVPLLAPDATVLFDDYYVDCPHLTDQFGCNQVIDGLNPAVWSVTRHPEVDRFVYDGRPFNVAVVEVRRTRR